MAAPVIDRASRVRCSALWAAAGDALGWITELGGLNTVVARTGSHRVERPVDWVRRIGGKTGVQIALPAGTYSDDTQLRLAVCRSIRGDGIFDAEAFGRIELTAWQGYALGAGNGSKAAASNLSKRGVNWFSNFFSTRTQKYTDAGGNGAAMRIQPHAWLKAGRRELIISALRDAVITHGHPHGIGGAVLHAIAVSKALDGGLLELSDFDEVIEALRELPSAVNSDRQLDAFWRPSWETMAQRTFESAIEKLIHELRSDLSAVASAAYSGGPSDYPMLIERIGLMSSRYRGSGIKTALAASLLSWLCRNEGPERALVEAANTTGSDTDTIATMAGAIMGAIAGEAPDWAIQDRPYIIREAERLAAIASGEAQDSFAYPDLARWQPPASQSDSIGDLNGSYVLVGLGRAEPISEENRNGDAIWQWMALPFGQTVLAKRRMKPAAVSVEQLPGERRPPQKIADAPAKPVEQAELFISAGAPRPIVNRDSFRVHGRRDGPTLDEITNDVIASGFDPRTIGEAFQYVLERRGLVEDVVSFASIIAKAQLARARKRTR